MCSPRLSEFCIRRRVEFSETDTAGMVHFSNFFRYMEACEHEMFRSLGLSVNLQVGGQEYHLPRVNAECTFRAPLFFEDEFEVKLLVREVRSKVIIHDFVVSKFDGQQTSCVAIGSVTAVCTQRQPDGALRAVEWPREVAALFEPARSKAE